MQSHFLNIDSSEVVRFTNALEKMHKSSLPIAIRSALNEAGFSMKGASGKEGLVKKFGEKVFITRNVNFLSAMTFVSKASGWNIDKMESIAGIAKYPNKTKVAEGLETQESGGTMKNWNPFIPMKQARSGKSNFKKVKSKYHENKIEGIGVVKNIGDKRALAYIARKYDYVIYTKNRTTLFEVKSRSRNTIELYPIYRYIRGFHPKVEQHSFISPAGLAAAAGIIRAYIKAAEKELKKLNYKK